MTTSAVDHRDYRKVRIIMAVLNVSQLVKCRNSVERTAKERSLSVNYTKPKINAGLQAIEDWFEANRVSLNTAISTATAPLVLTGAQKVALVKAWLDYKMGAE